VLDGVALGPVFSPITSVFPLPVPFRNAPFSFSSACCFYQKGKGEKNGTFEKAVFFWKSGNAGEKSIFDSFNL